MHIPIDPDGATEEPFSELLHLQMDFYTRLAEETSRYLRRLQGAAAPAVPGTVLMPSAEEELEASGSPGMSIELKLEVENRQRMHCVVMPTLSPMVNTVGVTWFPAAEPSPPLLLIAPEEVATLIIKLPLPANIPPGVYRGALLLQGVRKGAIAIAITVTSVGSESTTATPSKSIPTEKPRPGRKGVQKKKAAPKRSRRTPRRQP